jgi:Cu/Ag efflux protein CusF
MPGTKQHFLPQMACLVIIALAALMANPGLAQDAAKPTTFLGTVQTLNGTSLTVKNDAGATMQVTVQDGAKLLRIEPGQKTLAGASPFNLSDLATGDRVMARGSANPDGSLTASMLVAIKSADIAQKQAQEQEAWQKNGSGGLVKSVDAAAGTVTISIGTGGREEVIHTTPTTIFRRYAPGSVKFDQAVKSSLSEIKPGDQLRARGTKGPGTLDAEEIVSGSFRNIAGSVQAIDASASTVTVTDTTTKKPVLIFITPDSELKKLDPAVAQRIAARLSGGGNRPGGSGAPAGAGPAAGAPAGGGPPSGGAPGGAGPGGGPGGRAPGSGPDFQQVLAHAPTITLKDLQKGNMVIVVATEGQTPGSATGITLVAGVEQMLQASTSGSQAMFSSAWNLGGGGGGGEGGGEQ